MNTMTSQISPRKDHGRGKNVHAMASLSCCNFKVWNPYSSRPLVTVMRDSNANDIYNRIYFSSWIYIYTNISLHKSSATGVNIATRHSRWRPQPIYKVLTIVQGYFRVTWDREFPGERRSISSIRTLIRHDWDGSFQLPSGHIAPC